MTDIIQPVLEPEAAEFAKANDTPPFLYQLAPAEGRKTVDEVQTGDIDKQCVTDYLSQKRRQGAQLALTQVSEPHHPKV